MGFVDPLGELIQFGLVTFVASCNNQPGLTDVQESVAKPGAMLSILSLGNSLKTNAGLSETRAR